VNGRFLLDTNIIIGLLKREAPILAAVAAASDLFVPVVAMGEPYFEAAASSRPEANRAVFDQFVEGRVVLSCDEGSLVSSRKTICLPSRLIPHRHGPRAELQPTHESQVDTR
jgi:predicted nucleic acid-binding protein